MLRNTNDLMAHFEAYKDIPKVAELRARFSTIRTMLQANVFDDFSRIELAATDDTGRAAAQLGEAASVVDALEPGVRDELIRVLCSKELLAYGQIFSTSGDTAKLDRLERRYTWIRKTIRQKEESWAVLPPQWGALQTMCVSLCKVTRAALGEILEAQSAHPDVASLLAALQRTLELERELTDKFAVHADDNGNAPLAGDGGDDEGSSKNRSAAANDIRRKYAAMRRDNSGAPSSSAADAAVAEAHAEAVALAARFVFKGSISGVFDGYLGPYVAMEERELLEQLDKLVAEETWDAAAAGEAKVGAGGVTLPHGMTKAGKAEPGLARMGCTGCSCADVRAPAASGI